MDGGSGGDRRLVRGGGGGGGSPGRRPAAGCQGSAVVVAVVPVGDSDLGRPWHVYTDATQTQQSDSHGVGAVWPRSAIGSLS